MEASNGDVTVPMEVSDTPTDSRQEHKRAADGDAATPEPLFRSKGVLGEHKKAVSSIKFSRDGQKLATACKTYSPEFIPTWTLPSSTVGTKTVFRLTDRVGHGNTGYAFKSLFHTLLILVLSVIPAAADTEVYIWDMASGKQQLTLSGHTHGISDVAWARDQRFLASGSDDRSIRLWDAETVRKRSAPDGSGDDTSVSQKEAVARPADCSLHRSGLMKYRARS